LDTLKKLYNEALSYPGVIGLVIGTRPDCIDDEKLEYFRELSKKYYVIIEYGIESCYNKTLERINRGHTFEQSVEAIEKTARYGIKTGAHFMFGLPGESREDMLNQVHIINTLPLDNIKFHQLLIVKDTAMAKDYEVDPSQFTFFSMDEYIDFIISFLERLNPAFMVERFTSEVPPRFQAGPNWGLVRAFTVLQKLEKRLDELDTWQGKKFINS
jgi:radical SAM protein (TIGR01212 family)